MGRRSFALGVAASLACSRSDGTARPGGRPGASTSPHVESLELDFGVQPWGRAFAVVVQPAWGQPDERFPVLVALHGRGEALKDPLEGARGWPRDYAMVRAIDRLRDPPLTRADYEGFVDDARLAQTNAALKQAPFRGVVVACPWMPDLDPSSADDIAAYARFITDVLVPRVRREARAAAAPESTGIDGVSLGGAVALRIGLTRPGAFGAVGGIQPALSEGQSAAWTTLARSARSGHPELKLRLLTSTGDYFRNAISEVSRAWTAQGIAHDFADLPGPHDVTFNRGPGSIELLLWHDRVLRRT